MPEYSSTTITPSDGVQVPSMNGSTSGNFLLSALKSYILAEKGQANGLASLGSDGKLTAAQLPDLADDVIVVASYAVLPAAGTAGKIYITADNNKMYRWDPDLETPDYVELSVDLSAYATKAELAAEESARESADSNLKDAIQGNAQRIENLEVAVSGSLVQTNILTDPPSMANVRTITNANEILPWAILKRVGARAVAWNQLIQTREGIPHANQYYPMFIEQVLNIVNGHKYLFSALVPAGCNVYRQNQTGLSVGSYYYTVTNDTRIDFIATATETRTMTASQVSAVISKTSTTEQGYKLDNCMVFDLTLMDEYDSNLTDAQNIANFRAKFPASYYPYNTGEIIPLNPSAFNVVGWNKLNLARTKVDANYTTDTLMNWDETKCYKGSGSNDGQPNYAQSADVSNGKITVTPTYQGYGLSFPVKVLPNTSYYLKAKMTKGNKLYFNIGLYGADGAFVQRVYFSYDSASPYEGYFTFTTPANVYWANICFTGSANTETVYEEVNFNISQSDTSKPLHNGVYEEYKETTIDTSFTSDYKYVNPSCYDYSENVYDNGVVKRKEHSKVDALNLGNNQLVWDKSEQTGFVIFYTQNGLDTMFGIKAPSSGSNVANALCDIFAIDSAVNTNNGSLALSIGADGARIRISVASSSTYGSMTKEQFASAMNGVMLYFEKATEVVTTSSDPIPNIPSEDGTTITAITPQTDLVNAIDVPSTIAYMTKISS